MSEPTKYKTSLKKYTPFAFLILLTLVLMFYFRENRGSFGELVQKGKSDLVSLYTENLQPLLFDTDLNNEDVFNFAMYQTIPIDKKERDVLRVGNKSTGETNYQILPNKYKPDTKNYEKYLKYMSFSEDEKSQLDSLLESYKPELAEAILTDTSNTVAVSSRLANLQKAILTDIAAFSRSVNKTKVSDLFGSDVALLDSKKTLKLVNEIKSDTSKEYLVIANDTAFTSRIEFDTKEFEERIAKLGQKLEKMSDLENQLKIRVSPSKLPPPPKISDSVSGYSYVHAPPEFKYDDFEFNESQLDSLNLVLSEIEKSFQNFSINFESLNNNMKFSFGEKIDSGENISFELNLEGLGDLINKSIEGAMKHQNDAEYWQKYGAEIESLTTNMVISDKDSLKKLKEKLRELRNKKKQN